MVLALYKIDLGMLTKDVVSTDVLKRYINNILGYFYTKEFYENCIGNTFKRMVTTMTNKEIIKEQLKRITLENINDNDKKFGTNAQEISKITSLNRTLVSHCLNILNKEKNAIKINTRPVYFIDLGVFEDYFNVDIEDEVIYSSFRELIEVKDRIKSNRHRFQTDEYIFKDLIGYEGSLSYQLEQCKASVKYPPKGLSILIEGPTGSGKSFLASKVYEYAKINGYIGEDAPFLVFNCAKYAHNKELLAANLLGYKKGAFTGADKDMKGVIENGNGGYIFLDEVHRLSPEGQELLFYFMDKGEFRRIGENDVCRHSDIRFIFATTENPEDVLLKTFLRRIPITIKIPSLNERPNNEKFKLIHHFFREEAISIGCNIKVSKYALRILTHANFTGNVGQLKNEIRLACARAYNNNDFTESKECKYIYVNSMCLSDNITNNAVNDKMSYIDSFYNGYILQDLVVSESDNDVKIINRKYGNRIHEKFYDDMLELFSQIVPNEKDPIIIEKIKNLVDDYFGKLILNMNFYSKEDIRHARFDNLYKYMKDIFSILKSRYDVRYHDNQIYKLTCFLEKGMEDYYGLVLKNYEIKFKKYMNLLKDHYSKEYDLAYKIADFIKSNLDITIGDLEMVVMILYFISLTGKENIESVKAVLIAHGYSTASSIANVTNHLLGTNIFESFDMPIETSTQDIVNRIKQYFKEVNTSKGIVILVDMGSLEEIYKGLEDISHGTIGIINNLTTKLALKVGSDIKKGLSAEEIIKDIENVECYKCKIIRIKNKKEKTLIVTCFTGIGTAMKIKDLLIKSLGEYADNIKVTAYSYLELEKNKYNDNIFKDFDVVAIIGTEDPEILEVPFLYLEDIISTNKDHMVSNILEDVIPKEKIPQVKQSIMKYFTLESVLSYITILNPDKIIDQLETAIETLQYEMRRQFSGDTIICLYIHLSCLVERLVTKTQLEEEGIKNIELFKENHKDFIGVIKKSFNYIENYYSVNIPISEIYYLYEILNVKLDAKY